MLLLRPTLEFSTWLARLRDRRAQARIAIRLDRVEEGHFGDVKYFDGIGELRIEYGPGYRIYFVRREDVIVVLLCGGDKSTQARDIAKARLMAKEN